MPFTAFAAIVLSRPPDDMIRVWPSGDHSGVYSLTFAVAVTCVALPPAAGTIHTSGAVPIPVPPRV